MAGAVNETGYGRDQNRFVILKDKTMEKLTSIIVPVYNVREYLGECLDSLCAQTDRHIEILAVNDGSTDDSLNLLHEYAARDSRIKVFDKQNGGLSDARNYGLKRAAGDYILCVDSDDWIHPRTVELLKSRLEETDSEIAVSDMEYRYDDGRAVLSDGGRFDLSSVRKEPALISINNSACNKLFKKTLFAGIEFPVGKYYEDLATVPILLYKARQIVKVNQGLYYYRQRSGSIAHSANPKIFHIYDAIERVIRYVQAHGNEEAVLSELRRLYIVHGLDLTTLRIRDFDDRSIRAGYLRENMKRLLECYPEYESDPLYRSAPIKKRLIYYLLKKDKMDWVLKLYDR